jgi:hypothetical protein
MFASPVKATIAIRRPGSLESVSQSLSWSRHGRSRAGALVAVDPRAFLARCSDCRSRRRNTRTTPA